MRLLFQAQQKRVYILINRKLCSDLFNLSVCQQLNRRMRLLLIGTILFLHILRNLASNSTTRQDKFLSVFTVVKFPNVACGSTSALQWLEWDLLHLVWVRVSRWLLLRVLRLLIRSVLRLFSLMWGVKQPEQHLCHHDNIHSQLRPRPLHLHILQIKLRRLQAQDWLWNV